jgi:hypothetical protein
LPCLISPSLRTVSTAVVVHIVPRPQPQAPDSKELTTKKFFACFFRFIVDYSYCGNI